MHSSWSSFLSFPSQDEEEPKETYASKVKGNAAADEPKVDTPEVDKPKADDNDTVVDTSSSQDTSDPSLCSESFEVYDILYQSVLENHKITKEEEKVARMICVSSQNLSFSPFCFLL